MRFTLQLVVDDPSQVGEVRRQVTRLATALGFDETGVGRASLVATELATNLAKHARGGSILLQAAQRDSVVGVELLSLDQGPGMSDVARCLADGFSTAGSPGTGLGAIGRNSDLFELHSLPGTGTALLARVWARPPQPAGAAVEAGGVCVPKAGEEICGDGWAWAPAEGGGARVVVADGLGHGPEAHAASSAATRLFLERPELAPAELLEAMHGALRGTRGAAVTVVEILPGGRELRFAGIGNVAGATVVPGGTGRSLAALPGIVGHEMRRAQEWTAPWEPGALLVLHSDGVGTRWSLDRYPGLGARDPALVAGVLFRDHARGRDDATVVVLRHRARGAG